MWPQKGATWGCPMLTTLPATETGVSDVYLMNGNEI